MNFDNSLVGTKPISVWKLIWIVPLATAVATTANVIFYFQWVYSI